MTVRTNADTPEQVRNALAFGAVGIGLTRTEHMFFEGDRIDAMREMILADTLEAREEALAKLLPYQREDFFGIFKELKGYPATIRFLDPPLHEFLPNSGDQQKDLAKKLGIPVEKIQQRVHDLHEFNPMLGFRGCRLGIRYPEITAMQARAVFEAAADANKKGYKAKPEIMIPLVGFKKELDLQVEVVHEVARKVQAERKTTINYSVGTMIEVPRGAVTADEIAQTAEFFSFGTNDLTQTTLGMSRDDSGSFLPPYEETRDRQEEPLCHHRPDGRRRPDAHRGGEGPSDPQGHQAGDLRRARRRAGLGEVLRRARSRLRQLLAVPRPRGAAGGGTGGDRRAQEVGGDTGPGRNARGRIVRSARLRLLRLTAHCSESEP